MIKIKNIIKGNVVELFSSAILSVVLFYTKYNYNKKETLSSGQGRIQNKKEARPRAGGAFDGGPELAGIGATSCRGLLSGRANLQRRCSI